MGFLEKLGAKLVTKYGVVTGGEFCGCEMAFGSDPAKKVAMGDKAIDQILFMSGEEEKGRFFINGDLKELKYVADNADVLKVEIVFADGKTSFADVYITKNSDSTASKALSFINKVNKAGETDNEAARKKYHHVYHFLENMADITMSEENIKAFYDFMKKNSMDKITMNRAAVYGPLMEYYEKMLSI